MAMGQPFFWTPAMGDRCALSKYFRRQSVQTSDFGYDDDKMIPSAQDLI
jgi:hypothetical protein